MKLKRFKLTSFIKHRLTKFPKDLKKDAIFITTLGIIISLLFDFLSFFLQLGKDQVANGNVIFGLALITAYYTQSTLRKSIDLWLDDLRINYRDHYTTTINNNVAEVLLKIRGKVWRTNSKTNALETMSTNSLLISSKQYISLMWDFKTDLPKNIFQIISLICMFIGFIQVTQLEIQHTSLFIGIIIAISIFSVIFSSKRLNLRKKFRRNRKESLEKREEFLNDVLNIKPVSQKHAKYMADNYINASKEVFAFDKKDRKGLNKVNFLESFTNSLATISIIAIKVFETGLENIDLTAVLSIIALVAIYSQIINRVNSIIRLTENCGNNLEEIKNYESDFFEITYVLDEEEKEENNSNTFGILESLTIPPFTVQYQTIGEETPFSLENSETLKFYSGDIVLLTGPTGSGKTTFINLISGTLKFDDFELFYKRKTNGSIHSIVHQTDGRLGCNNVLSELVFDEKVNVEKLEYILKGLHLYEEIFEKNPDIIEHLKKSKVENYSSGQKQRFAVARLLYNIDDSVQIIAFDEATNALNDEITFQTLSFIKEFCPDKLLVIATHQVEIGQKIATKQFRFMPTGTHYKIVET